MKKILKTILKFVVVYLILITVFVTLLTLTSLIPRDMIAEKTRESAEILNSQTNRLYMPIRNLGVMFDNFTDSLMINTAYSIDTKTPFYSAMVARKNYLPGITKTINGDTVGKLKSASKYTELDQVGELNDTVNNDIDESFEYARYWHGYLVMLRPALIFTNVETLREALRFIFPLLAVFLVAIIAKKVNILPAIAIRSRAIIGRLFICWYITTKFICIFNSYDFKFDYSFKRK